MNYTKEIDKYLDGELKREELRQFENELSTNSELVKTIEKYRKLSECVKQQVRIISSTEKEDNISESNIERIIKTYQYEDGKIDPEDLKLFKKKLNKGYETYIKNKDKRFYRLKRPMLYAAAAVFLLITVTSVILYFLKNTSYTNERLYSMYYEPYNKNIYTRTGTDESQNTFFQALRKYAEEDYNNALELFQQIPSTDNYKLPAYFYSGISYMEINQFQDAIRSFIFIIEQGRNELINDSEWYLGLCYLKTYNKDKASIQFQVITTGNSIYKEKAKKISKKLDLNRVK